MMVVVDNRYRFLLLEYSSRSSLMTTCHYYLSYLPELLMKYNMMALDRGCPVEQTIKRREDWFYK